MSSTPTITYQAKLDGVNWTDITADVVQAEAVRISYGISGIGARDRVASTGTLDFVLDNSALNSGAQSGYYSPGHANCRSGFAIGLKVRVKIVYGATTRYKFVGKLKRIQPTYGTNGERRTYCMATDWMDAAARKKVRYIPTQISKRGDELMTTVLAAMDEQPEATDFETGRSTFPYALDNAHNITAITLFQQIADSEYGFVYVRGDGTTGGVLVFADRQMRQKETVAATFNATYRPNTLAAEQNIDDVYQTVNAQVHPRRVDSAATTVLYSLQTTPAIAAGETLIFNGQYSDPTQRAVKVGGRDMVDPPAATTDYTLNTQADGLGVNLTGSATVTAIFGADNVRFSVTNGSASAGYITKLQCRGKGLYDDSAVWVESQAAAVTTENSLDLDMPLQNDTAVAKQVADYVRVLMDEPRMRITAFGFWANTSDTLMAAMLGCDISSRVAVTDAMTAIDSDYFINHVSLTITGSLVFCEWAVAPAEDGSAWLIGISALGVDTFLGY